MSRDDRQGGVGDGPHGAEQPAERDAWLSEALRHAPDASTGAPPSVRDAILREARQASAAATRTRVDTSRVDTSRVDTSRVETSRVDTARRTAPWAGWWSWLTQPSVAAGFASVMVATLVGVMWWGRPIDEPLREANRPDAAPLAVPAPPAAAARASAAPPATTAVAAAPAAPAARAEPAAPAVPAPVAVTAAPTADMKVARPESAAPPTERRADRPQRPAAPETAAKRAARSEEAGQSTEPKREAEAMADSPRPAAESVAGPAEASVPVPVPVPVPTQAPVGAAATVPPVASPQITSPPSAAPPPAAPPWGTSQPGPTRSRSQPARNPSTDAAERAPSAFATPSTAAGAARATAADPVVRLRALVAARPDAWSWQRAGGPEQPMNDAVQRWLAQLDEATRARWQPEPATPAGNGATTLRLLRDGRLHTTVRIETGGVQLAPLVADSAPAPTLRAGMPAADAAALKAALEQLTP